MNIKKFQKDDLILIDKIRKGDLSAFEKFFRENYPGIFSLAKSLLNNDDDAEEIVQELFFNIWNKKETLEIHTSPKAYLYKAVRNNCLIHIKHEYIKQKYVDYTKNNKNDFTPLPDQVYDAAEINGIINQTIHQFPERTYEIFTLNRFEGMKYKEIAKKLSISIKTVEANMGKALKLLRENLKDYISIFALIIILLLK